MLSPQLHSVTTALGNTFWSKDGLVTQLAPGRLALVQRLGAQIDPQGTLVATERVAA